MKRKFNSDGQQFH